MCLCQEMGISRTPFREALRILEAEGIIKSYRNKGSFVSSFTIDDVREILELRAVLEGKAVRDSLMLQQVRSGIF